MRFLLWNGGVGVIGLVAGCSDWPEADPAEAPGVPAAEPHCGARM